MEFLQRPSEKNTFSSSSKSRDWSRKMVDVLTNFFNLINTRSLAKGREVAVEGLCRRLVQICWALVFQDQSDSDLTDFHWAQQKSPFFLPYESIFLDFLFDSEETVRKQQLLLETTTFRTLLCPTKSRNWTAPEPAQPSSVGFIWLNLPLLTHKDPHLLYCQFSNDFFLQI